MVGRRAPITRCHVKTSLSPRTDRRLLPTLHAAGVYFRIKAVVENPAARTEDLVREINLDPALTLRVLRLVNSPLYATAGKVETVLRAVHILGHRAIELTGFFCTRLNVVFNLEERVGRWQRRDLARSRWWRSCGRSR
ncbi:MAG: HDOD domain-containing protein, partial [Betaproteobacteria bacterium]|nr:HDOD domain-containing protein [Betaproteobacteria bacterium]